MIKMKKILLLMFVGIFLLSFALAEPSYNFRKDTDVDIRIPVHTNNFSQCVGCSCQLSITRPNGDSLVNNASMNFVDGYASYTINKTTNSVYGEHSARVVCGNGADYGFSTFTYEVTQNGSLMTTATSLGYAGVLLITIFFIILFIYWFRTNEALWIKSFTFGGVWFLSILMTYILYIVAENYLYTSLFVSVFFKWIFLILLILSFPMILGMIVLYIYVMITNRHMMRMLEHGVPEDRAMMRRGRR